MPICRTCRGEYAQQEALCPKCGKPVGNAVNQCGSCKFNTKDNRLCPRCKSDVSVWEREDITLLNFIFSQKGILGLLPALTVIFIHNWFWSVRESSRYYYPLLTIVTFGLSLLVFYVLYTKRLFWWERWWASQVYRATPVSIVLTMSLSGVGGISLSALSVFLYALWHKPENLLHKGIFTLVYVLAYLCLTIMLTLLSVHLYISRLERYAPQPIFVDTRHLLSVVVDAVAQSVNIAARSGIAMPSVSGNIPVNHEVVEAIRIPENGGIIVLLRECKLVRHPDATGRIQRDWTERLWRVQADRWGRVQSVRPGALGLYDKEKRVFREYGRYS